MPYSNRTVRFCRILAPVSVFLLILAAATADVHAEDAASLIKTIKAVGDEGKGNAAASKALKQLASQDAAALPVILRSFDQANPLAANWLRSAFETIADREIKQNGKLPSKPLKTFITKTTNNPRARRLAFEWLGRVDKSLADELIPGMLLDPSPEFRRDAVARLIAKAGRLNEKGDDEAAAKQYKQALSGAVHEDQVKQIVKPLEKLGHKVNLPAHFGFLTQWKIIGPFDNVDKKGFAAVYPPEKAIDFDATLDGQLDKVSWKPIESKDDYGLINIAEQIENYKGSCMYATTDFFAKSDQPVEIRLGTPNAWKLWLNGRLVFAREEYHRGTRMDQYRVAVTMKPGRNTILFKICQNEQTQDWAQRYQYQIRVCNAAGSAVSSAAKRTSQADTNAAARR